MSRISAYRAAVKQAKQANKRLGRDVDTDELGYKMRQSAKAYKSLTRSDCAKLWNPECPEAKDPSRRP